MADYSAEIAELEELINSATSEVSVDGMRTKHDLEAARKRLRELKALNDADIAAGTTRPTVMRFNPGRGW